MKANKLIPLLRRGDGSTLSLDFTTMGSLDSRFTFTRASTATFINSSGLVATAGTNVARFDYDPTTLAPRGLLIEGSVTNLCLQSAAMRTSPWSTANLTTAGASITAPDGTANGVELVWTNTTAIGLGYTFQEVAVAASTAYTMSVYLKPKGVNVNTALYIQARAGTTSLGYMTVSFVHTSGSMGTVANGPFTSTSATSTNVGNGWYRVTVTGTSPATTTNIRFFIVNGNIGDGTDGVYAWGAQLEAGSGASSYISSGASQGQRAADVMYMDGANFSAWWPSGQAEYTMYIAGDITRSPATTQFLWLARNGSGGLGSSRARVFIVTSSSIRGNNTINDLISGLSATANTPFKVALAIKNADQAISVNNGTTTAIVSATDTSLFADATQLVFNPNSDVFQHISSLKFWPTRLPNATLQSLTQ